MSAVVSGPPETTASWRRARRPALRSALSLLASLYLGAQLCLGAWVAVPALALGWSPRVVLSGSMSPTVGAGDIVLTETGSTPAIAVGSLVVVDRADGRGTNLHRVAEEENGRFRTKGDANTAFDPGTVGSEDVHAVGRLLVPLVGTPAMWWQTGRYVPAALWAITVVGAVALSRRRQGTT